MFNLVFVYISLFKIRSILLTLVVIFNSLLDLLIGLIPVVGTILDFFHRSYNCSCRCGLCLADKKSICIIWNKASRWC
ncbi:hypothetical protein C7N83_09945 [Neisseria iguanae]|uniref:Uncharacterized protein n=1 Tax=Neisseria iguanae TaxID=90242 RepID=A0A2P7TYL0_9NEIS|nr:hypothetical protein C7N83_09945 [Neisseria iguanae]